MNKKFCIGLMSGTSLDGLDIALCSFEHSNNTYTYTIHAAETVAYDQHLKSRLTNAQLLNGEELIQLDRTYGQYIGNQVNLFISKQHQCPPIDFIASHGHTIFHNPAASYTLQIGSGATIYASTQIPTLCDFRSVDVALGGQGAPLVPIGDQLLFSDYIGCLNLGGFANISIQSSTNFIAYDICATNIVLNELCKELNILYDDGGKIARNGQLIEPLYKELNALSYFEKKPPKSLGREWVETFIHPILFKYIDHPVTDRLHTFVQHIASQIVFACEDIVAGDSNQILVTGGGAYNQFLIELCNQQSTHCSFIIPDPLTIEFKEALIFAFLGYLKLENKVNALQSVTGARSNSIGGALYGPVQPITS
jgi:anhydro-N-acetylmuramic acid kinase